jgi:hypothetical protein
MRTILIAATAALLSACGEGEAEAPKKVAAPATLPAGDYEVTIKTASLVSADQSPLPTFAKQGDTRTVRGCVGSDGLPAADLLATKGDTCQLQNPYVRSGRLNFQLNCNRKGQGNVMSDVTGSYTAEGFTGTINASSFFPGSGDFKLVEEVTARKVADQCSAPAAEGSKTAAS